NPRNTSAGNDAPPETHTRRVDASNAPRRGWCRIAEYIVGTPWKTVARSRSMISSARPASKRGISDSAAPAAIAAFIEQVWPNEWKSGRAPRKTSSDENECSFTTAATFEVRLE